MVIHSWLRLFSARLRARGYKKIKRRRVGISAPALIERLEQRELLTAVAVDDAEAVDLVDGSVDIDALANDWSDQAMSLTFTGLTQPMYGTVEFVDDTGYVTTASNAVSLRYTPDPMYTGTFTFTYSVDDGYGVDEGLVSITVTDGESVSSGFDETYDDTMDDLVGTNDAPVAHDNSVETAFETPVLIDVLTNDSDIDGDHLTITSVTMPMYGMTTLLPRVDSMIWNDWLNSGSQSYTSFEQFYEYVYMGDSASLLYDIEYTPTAGFSGQDTFSYTISDGNGGESTAYVSVTVLAQGVNPSTSTLNPVDDSISTPEDTPVTIDVLANDGDSSLEIDSFTSGMYGTVELRPRVDEYTWDDWLFSGGGYNSFEDWYANYMGMDPSTLAYDLVYSPTAGYAGEDSFTYTVLNTAGEAATATVYVTVTEQSVMDDVGDAIDDATGGYSSSSSGDTGGDYVDDTTGGETGGTSTDTSTDGGTSTSGSGIEDDIGGSSSSGTGDPDYEPPVDEQDPSTTFTLESGIVLDPYVGFVLPIDQRDNTTVTTTGGEDLNDSLDVEGTLFSTVGVTTWTQTITKTLNGDDWTYTESYDFDVTSTTTGDDGSTSSSVAWYDYTFVAQSIGSVLTYTLYVTMGDTASGSYTDSWSDTDTESGFTDAGGWNIDWTLSWSDIIDMSFTSDSSMGTSSLTTSVTSETTSTSKGSGNYSYDVTGGQVSGTMSLDIAGYDWSSVSVTETPDIDGVWQTTGGTASYKGSFDIIDNSFTGSGTYQYSDETSSISGTITEGGSVTSHEEYNSDATWQSDGTWLLNSGETKFNGKSNSSYSYSGTGSYSDTSTDTAGTSKSSGSITESGYASVWDEYNGTSTVGADGKWTGSTVALGGSAAGGEITLTGTYSYDTAGGDSTSGTSYTKSDFNDNFAYESTTALDANEEWQPVSGFTKASGATNFISTFSGTGTYTTTLADGKTGTISGTTTESGNVYENTYYSIDYTVANNEWQLVAGSHTTKMGDSFTFGYQGTGSYSYDVEGGVVSGAITTDSGEVSDTFDAVFVDELNANEEWETTSGTVSISGYSKLDYVYNGSGNYGVQTAEVTSSGTITEDGYVHLDDTYNADGDLVLTSLQADENGDVNPEWTWTSGKATSSTQAGGYFEMKGSGTINSTYDGGSFNGKMAEWIIIDNDVNENYTQTINSDGTWTKDTGSRTTTEYSKIAFSMEGTAKSSDSEIEIDVFVTAADDVIHDMNLLENVNSTTGEWEMTSGTQFDQAISSTSATITGKGSVTSGNFGVDLDISGNESTLLVFEQDQNVVNNAWETVDGQLYMSSSSDLTVKFTGGGSLDAGDISMDFALDGETSTESSFDELSLPDAAGEYHLTSGTKSTTDSDSLSLTITGAGTTTTAVDGGTFNNTIIINGLITDDFTVDTKQTVTSENGEMVWGGVTGSMEISNSDYFEIKVLSSGSMTNATTGGSVTSNITLDMSTGSSFSMGAKYKLDVDESTGEPNWIAESGTLTASDWSNQDSTLSSSGKSTQASNGGSVTNTFSVIRTAGSATNTTVDSTMTSNGTWAAPTGTSHQSNYVDSTHTYAGIGTYSFPVEGGSISGTINSGGTHIDKRSESYDYTIHADGSQTLFMGSVSVFVSNIGGMETVGSGTYGYAIQDGYLSGTMSQDSKSSYTYSETLTGSAIMGAAWTFAGGKSDKSTSSTNSSFTGTGSYSRSDNDNSDGRTSSTSGSKTEDGKSHSESTYEQIWTLNQLTGEFGTGTGLKASLSTSEYHSKHSATGTFTVDHTTTNIDSQTGVTRTVDRSGSGTYTESGFVDQYSDQQTGSSLTPSGTWVVTVDEGGASFVSHEETDDFGTITMTTSESYGDASSSGSSTGSYSSSQTGTSDESFNTSRDYSENTSYDHLGGEYVGFKSLKTYSDKWRDYQGTSGSYTIVESPPTPSAEGNASYMYRSESGTIIQNDSFAELSVDQAVTWGYNSSSGGGDWAVAGGTKIVTDYSSSDYEDSVAGVYTSLQRTGSNETSTSGVTTRTKYHNTENDVTENYGLAGVDNWIMTSGDKSSYDKSGSTATVVGGGFYTFTFDEEKTGRKGSASAAYVETANRKTNQTTESAFTYQFDSQTNSGAWQRESGKSTWDVDNTGSGYTIIGTGGSYEYGPITDGTLNVTNTSSSTEKGNWEKSWGLDDWTYFGSGSSTGSNETVVTYSGSGSTSSSTPDDPNTPNYLSKTSSHFREESGSSTNTSNSNSDWVIDSAGTKHNSQTRTTTSNHGGTQTDKITSWSHSMEAVGDGMHHSEADAKHDTTRKTDENNSSTTNSWFTTDDLASDDPFQTSDPQDTTSSTTTHHDSEVHITSYEYYYGKYWEIHPTYEHESGTEMHIDISTSDYAIYDNANGDLSSLNYGEKTETSWGWDWVYNVPDDSNDYKVPFNTGGTPFETYMVVDEDGSYTPYHSEFDKPFSNLDAFANHKHSAPVDSTGFDGYSNIFTEVIGEGLRYGLGDDILLNPGFDTLGDLIIDYRDLAGEVYHQYSGWVHFGLDAAGMIPLFGAIPDLANTALYAMEGDWRGAGGSFVAAIPIIGQYATTSKWAIKGLKGVEIAYNLYEGGSMAYEGYQEGNALQTVLGMVGLGVNTFAAKSWAGLPCFPAGTPILTPLGFKAIEEIRKDDLVLSRPEEEPHADVGYQRVLEAHQRVGEILTIHIGGREIQTTTEHPFFVRRWENPNRPADVYALQSDGGLATAAVDPVISHFDWTEAQDLRPGDEVSTSDGRWLQIDRVERDGTETVVYNMTVEEWHTYFIGEPGWGFDVWVHNDHSFNNIRKEATKKVTGWTEKFGEGWQNVFGGKKTPDVDWDAGETLDVGPHTMGRYKDVAGHHPHQQAARSNNKLYDADEALTVADDGSFNHTEVSRQQVILNAEARRSYRQTGIPYDLEAEEAIQRQAMKAGGMSDESINIILEQSRKRLEGMGALQPTRIPGTRRGS